jgi:Reverse transcriptase (RNA-dependent DNA polymerase)
MTDTGGRDRDCSLNRMFLGNVVLKSSYKQSRPGMLKFCHLNPGSAAAHVDEINALFDGVDMDIVCVSETWYKGWHTNKRIGIPGYQIVRADRKDGRRGGGVAMFIRAGIRYKILAKSPDACIINYLFVEIKYHGHDCLIGLVYNPPRIEGLPIIAQLMQEYYPKYERSLLLGDFNVNLLVSTPRCTEFQQALDDVCLSVISRIATNYTSAIPTLIDICASCDPDSIKMFSQISLPGMNTGHDLIYGSYEICEVAQNNVEVPHHFYRSYDRIHMEQLIADIEAQDWSAIYNMSDPDQQLQHFNKIIIWLLNLHAPLRKYVKKDPVNPWFTFDVEKAVIERNIAYRVWKRRKTISDRNRYKDLRRRVHYLIRQAKRSYMSRFLNPNLPSKTLWRNLEAVGAKDSSDNNVIFTPDQLNAHFTSVTNDNLIDPPLRPRMNSSRAFGFSNTYELEVFNSVLQVKSNAIGMDEVPMKFLRILLPYILPYITHIFNTVLTTSCFPRTWKVSKILPLAKTAEPSALSDYRPISILPALSKALEVIIRRQITAHVEDNGLLNRFQSGFRSKHSTSTALLKITNDLLKASESKMLSILVLLDFSKAFDSVDHQILCDKLAHQFNFTTSAVNLIRSYLSDRVQLVNVNGAASSFLPLSSGVVQGSVLGPLLFSLFINDITSFITNCKYHLYADDVQLYISCKPNDIASCVSLMNEDLHKIHRWSVSNGISINPTKSQAMIINPSSSALHTAPAISLGNNEIPYCAKLKNLGLMMNQNLTWNDQISKICKNVYFSLKRLWTTALFTPIETKKKLVTALIIPQFLYCDVIFSKTTARLRERLKIALNSCARYIYGIPRRQHISEHTNKILGVPLDTFFSYRICQAMFRLIKSGSPSYLYDELQFGRSERIFGLLTPSHRSFARASSFFVQGAILWNGLPVEVRRESSMGKFKKECLLHLCRSV